MCSINKQNAIQISLQIKLKKTAGVQQHRCLFEWVYVWWRAEQLVGKKKETLWWNIVSLQTSNVYFVSPLCEFWNDSVYPVLAERWRSKQCGYKQLSGQSPKLQLLLGSIIFPFSCNRVQTFRTNVLKLSGISSRLQRRTSWISEQWVVSLGLEAWNTQWVHN